jgi:lipoprotein NlpD
MAPATGTASVFVNGHRCAAPPSPRRRRRVQTLLAGLCVVMMPVISGCTSSARAPVLSRDSGQPQRATVSPSTATSEQTERAVYRVQKGDTLYSIAWRFGLDYRRLAQWNRISEPYTIYPGQKLRLRAETRSRRSRAAGSRRATGDAARTATNPPADSSHSATTSVIDWQWPTRGKLVQLDTPIAKKGVDISGRRGQSITAAANGRVVYSGSGLLGYGKLIIIKHSDVYLSAYAHNDEIYVKEGDRVSVGQKIATMGLGNHGKPVLHFEIRKDGKPISPLSRLPKLRS